MARLAALRLDPLVIAAWELANDWLDPRTLPLLARKALARGADSPSLQELAAGRPEDERDNRLRFAQALREMGVPSVEGEKNVWTVVRHFCAEAVAEPMQAVAAATRLRDIREKHVGLPLETDLRTFTKLLQALEANPDRRPEVEEAIVAEAEELLGRKGPRRWVCLVPNTQGAPFRPFSAADMAAAADVSLSSALMQRVTDWNDRYNARVPQGDDSPEWWTQEEAVAFESDGTLLAAAVQEELGPGWYVAYVGVATEGPALRLRPSRLLRIRRRLARGK